MEKGITFVEGQRYPFSVEKKIEIPENGFHFVLKGVTGQKYLLREILYKEYGIEVGQSIICRVDKINCVGEMFLEPVNPWYREGESYPFTVEGMDVRTDENGKDHDCLTVKDERGGIHNVFTDPASETPSIGQVINLRVKRIAKGTLTLSSEEVSDHMGHLSTGETYSFRVTGIGTAIDGRQNYIITDPFGKSHIIPVRYYHYYGLKVGSSFLATIETSNSMGKKVIEPENPWYRRESKITVDVLSVDPDITLTRYHVKAIDSLGKEHDIISDVEPSKGTYDAEVIKMRKGRPVLKLILR